jgi:hypothetical protein
MKLTKILATLCCAFVLVGSAAAADKSCCDKAKEAGKECTHPCCVDAKKAGKTCEKCNAKKEDKKK